MRRTFKRSRIAIRVALVAAVAASTVASGAVGSAGAVRSVRGFDGTTITVASLGIASQFGTGVQNGAGARIKRFNDNNEIKGVKIKYAEYADDTQDAAKALNEARRLVTQVGVFAIVGDTSANNPGDYFKQQHVPYFGYAFDNTYCSPKPTTTLYGFGFNGCIVPSDPTIVPDNAANPYTYVSGKTGKKNPTIAMFSNDSQSGKNAVKFQKVSYAAAGFKIVATSNQQPVVVSDYTPFAQAMLTADNGKAPDAIVCLLSTDCIPMYNLIQANGYSGTYITSLYSSILVKAMNGSLATTPFVPVDQNTKGLQQLKKDLDTFSPGLSAKIDTQLMAGYLSTDMFIQALKTAAKKGKSNITPENVQKAAANQTWKIEGLAGPTTYPNATASSYASCSAEVLSDGTAWVQKVPFTCSTKTYPVK